MSVVATAPSHVREVVQATVTDLVGEFLYYDRKEDDRLPRGAIEAAIKAGELTANDIVEDFRRELMKGLK